VITAFRLDAAGDLDVTAGRLSIVTDGVALVQRLDARLRTAWREYFLDLTFGVDYFGSVLADVPNHVRENAFVNAISEESLITKILSVTVTNDNAGKFRADFAAESVFGELDRALDLGVG
jgi:hypothetical protein